MSAASLNELNPKGRLLEHCQRHRLPAPLFVHSLDEMGFKVSLEIYGQTFTSSSFGRKREAEGDACQLAMNYIQENMRRTFGSNSEHIDLFSDFDLYNDNNSSQASGNTSVMNNLTINYKGKLLEVCQKRHIFPLPKFTFIDTGNGFRCSISVSSITYT